MGDKGQKNKCQLDIKASRDYREDIPKIVSNLVGTCNGNNCFDHVGPEPIPSRDAIIGIIHQLQRILFPGYFIPERLDRVNLEYYLGMETISLFENLSCQLTLCIRHECIRYNLSCTHCVESGREEAMKFIRELPDIRILLAKDIRAALEGDPAAKNYDEIILCYPGLHAVTVYRIAHQLHHQKISLMPRIMSEYVHGLTGIDIHPGAHIGASFFIDHGVGVVIGETADIGNGVRIYQGVTLGALSLPKDAVQQLRGKKRHPTIEDDVIIYSGATILGGETIIGAKSVIGGNVWLTESVPPETKVFIKKPELILKRDDRKLATASQRAAD
jgi:serine O-acetyltransferase